MRRIVVILILGIFSCSAWAQSLVPIGNPEISRAILMETVGNDIYTISYNDRDGEYRLAHYDLLNWTDLGALPALPKDGVDGNAEFHLTDLQHYKGELYVCGSFKYDAGTQRNNVALKWDGSSWTDISNFLVQNSVQLTRYLIYNDQIVLVGIFSSAQPVNLLTYKKGTWSPLGDSGTESPSSDLLKDAIYWNGKIYASGIFSKAGVTGNRYLMSFDGTEWKFNINPPFLHQNSYFAVHNGYLVLTGTPNAPTISDYDYFKRFDGQGNAWEDYSSGLKGYKILSVNSMASDGDVLWASGTFVHKTSKDTFYLLYNKENTWHRAETPLREAHGLKHWNKTAVVYGSFNMQGVRCIGSLREGVAYIQGQLFADMNQNCIFDENEEGVGRQELLLEPGGYKIMVNSDGSFAFTAIKGDYSLRLLPSPFWKTNCGNNVLFKVSENINLSQIDFGMEKIPGKVDLDIYLHDFKGKKVKPGLTEHFVLEIGNTGTQDVSNFEVQIRINPKGANATFSIPPSSYVDGVATWDIASLAEAETKYIEIDITIPVATESFDLSYSLITEDVDDVMPDNNRDSISFGFYQKDENLQKNSDMGEMIDPKTTKLGYDIFFQNAIGRTIDRMLFIDTLDRDISLKHNRHHSYPPGADYKLEQEMQPTGGFKNTLKWAYTKAGLPDSASKPAQSVAHIGYEIQIFENSLPDFGIVCNEAILIIENLEPLMTNEVCGQVNTASVPQVSYERLAIYPNPTDGIISVNNVLDHTVEMQIIGLDGRVIKTLQAPAFEVSTFDLSELTKGVYFISAPGYAAHKLILQ